MRKYNGKSNLLGENIEEYRLSKGISREHLAESLQLLGLNIDRTNIYRIEKGLVVLKDFELLSIAKVLDMDLNSLKNSI